MSASMNKLTQSKNQRSSCWFWIKRLIIWAVLIFIAIQLWFLGWVFYYKYAPPGQTAFMSAGLDRLRETNPNAVLKYEWVPYDQISKHLKQAVLAAEDDGFVTHDGVNWEAIEKAWEKNLDKGKVVRGGSTITQQLAKNLFLSGSRSYIRKGQELLITWMLEWVLPKRRIFELYLNIAEWGEGIYGAKAAAKYYFSISPKQLNEYQAAHLAVMLPRPRFYQKRQNSAFLAKRANRVLRDFKQMEVPL
jgi:monofunctional biosynthetic peptidoglycan transglycosylase